MMVQMWRCSTCGKWSHAKRRPKGHARWIPASDKAPEYEPVEKVLSYEPGSVYDHLTGESDPGGWMVECGPFEEWHAERVS